MSYGILGAEDTGATDSIVKAWKPIGAERDRVVTKSWHFHPAVRGSWKPRVVRATHRFHDRWSPAEAGRSQGFGDVGGYARTDRGSRGWWGIRLGAARFQGQRSRHGAKTNDHGGVEPAGGVVF